MTRWERNVERGMGYLGLFMIGSMAWLADHLGQLRPPERAPEKVVDWASEKEVTR